MPGDRGGRAEDPRPDHAADHQRRRVWKPQRSSQKGGFHISPRPSYQRIVVAPAFHSLLQTSLDAGRISPLQALMFVLLPGAGHSEEQQLALAEAVDRHLRQKHIQGEDLYPLLGIATVSSDRIPDLLRLIEQGIFSREDLFFLSKLVEYEPEILGLALERVLQSEDLPELLLLNHASHQPQENLEFLLNRIAAARLPSEDLALLAEAAVQLHRNAAEFPVRALFALHPEWALALPPVPEIVQTARAVSPLPPTGGKIPFILRRDGSVDSSILLLPPTYTAEQQVQTVLENPHLTIRDSSG